MSCFKEAHGPPANLIADGVSLEKTFSSQSAVKKSWYERLPGVSFICVLFFSPFPPYFFSQFSAFSNPPLQKQQGSSAKLSPTCAVEQADTPAE